MKNILSQLRAFLSSLLLQAKKIGSQWFPVIGVGIVCILCGITIYKFTYDRWQTTVSFLNDDLDTIVAILKKIDGTCGILSLKHERNYIDFLTVKEFVGSEIGGLNLAFPHKWEGPYVDDNPSFKGILYELVTARDGVYIVPGTGVRLPNGYEMGKDITITPQTSVADLMTHEGALCSEGMVYARKLNVIIGDVPSQTPQGDRLERIESSLKNFNEAFSFNEAQPVSK